MSLGAISIAKSSMLLLNVIHYALNPMYLNTINSSQKQTKIWWAKKGVSGPRQDHLSPVQSWQLRDPCAVREQNTGACPKKLTASHKMRNSLRNGHYKCNRKVLKGVVTKLIQIIKASQEMKILRVGFEGKGRGLGFFQILNMCG